MSYEPYVRFPDEAEAAIKQAAQARGFSTTAAYLRHTVLEDAADATGSSLSDITGVTTDE